MALLAHAARKIGRAIGRLPAGKSLQPEASPMDLSAVDRHEPDHLKLVTIIVPEEEADRILDALIGQGYPATKIASSGGFLHKGMATILSGVESSEVDAVVFLVKEICPSHYKLLPQSLRLPGGRDHVEEPIEVRVGGAVIFVQDVERFEKT